MSPPSRHMSRQYNYIYQKLVTEDADVAGAIAYSLYKKEKQAFIENFKKQNNKDPEEEDIAKFHEIVSTPTNIERFRLQATGVLGNFMDEALAETIKDIERDCNETNMKKIQAVVNPLNKPLWKQYLHGSLQSLLGAFLFALLIGAVLFVVSLSETEYSFTIGGKGDIKIEQAAQTDTTPCNDTATQKP